MENSGFMPVKIIPDEPVEKYGSVMAELVLPDGRQVITTRVLMSIPAGLTFLGCFQFHQLSGTTSARARQTCAMSSRR